MTKQILVTGASGFMGQATVNRLLNSKNKISIAVRGKCQVDPRVTGFLIDYISSETNWENALAGVKVVVHLAAVAHNKSDDLSYINEVNVKGTLNLAQQAADSGVERFIFISSIGVLGNRTENDEFFDEDTKESPHSEYSQSKLDAEVELLKIASETSLEVVIIRPVLVYGVNAPGNFGKLVNLVNKVPMLPFGLCKNKRSFISIDNLVDFIMICIEHPKAKNEVFCISDGIDLSIKEFTNGIATSLNKRLIQFPMPSFIFNLVGLLTGKQDQVDQLIGDLQINSSKARNILGWTPPYTMAETLSHLTKIDN